eukprot:157587-Prorocentrum_minimum.AAC.2
MTASEARWAANRRIEISSTPPCAGKPRSYSPVYTPPVLLVSPTLPACCRKRHKPFVSRLPIKNVLQESSGRSYLPKRRA